MIIIPIQINEKKTEEIMKQFGEEPRVRYIKHEKNKNGATARNTGIKNSRGEYIAFLDDDDIFLPGKIKKQVKYLTQHKEFGGAYTWRIYRGQVVGSEQTGDLSKALLDMSFTPCTPSLMLRRECVERIKGFDESYNRHQDYEFLLRFFEYYKLGVVKEPLVEIIGNNVDNQLKGLEAVRLKRRFLETFSSNIEKIDSENPGFKKRVYANHYALLMIKLIRYGNLGLFVNTYVTDARKGGLLFWKCFFTEIKHIVGRKLHSDNKKSI